LFAQDTAEWSRQSLDHGDRDFSAASGRRNLGPNETGPNDHNSLRATVKVSPKRECIVEASQDMNPGHALRARECATARPSGNQQTIDLFAVFAVWAIRRQHARREIKPSGPSREPEIKI